MGRVTVAGVTTTIDLQLGYAKEVPLKDSAGNIVTNSSGNTIMTIVSTDRMLESGLEAYGLKASQEILHGLARSAITGEDIQTSLATSVGNVAFEYIGHTMTNDLGMDANSIEGKAFITVNSSLFIILLLQIFF